MTEEIKTAKEGIDGGVDKGIKLAMFVLAKFRGDIQESMW